jgi:hypothetical protein
MIVAIQNVYLLEAIAALPFHTVDVMNAATVMLTSAASVDAVASDADAAAAVVGVQVPVSIVDLDAAEYCNKYQSACLKGHWTQDPLLPPKDLL